MKYFSNQLAVAAVLLSCVGLLVFFQIIRPFRNPVVDGPLSLAAWGIGTVLAIIALFLPQKSRALCAVGIRARFAVVPQPQQFRLALSDCRQRRVSYIEPK